MEKVISNRLKNFIGATSFDEVIGLSIKHNGSIIKFQASYHSISC